MGGCELFPGGHALRADVRDTVCREGCAPFTKKPSLAAASHCLCGTFGPVPCGEGPVPSRPVPLGTKTKAPCKERVCQAQRTPPPPCASPGYNRCGSKLRTGRKSTSYLTGENRTGARLSDRVAVTTGSVGGGKGKGAQPVFSVRGGWGGWDAKPSDRSGTDFGLSPPCVCCVREREWR